MIPIADADEQLKRLLVENEDTEENGAAFPQPARYRALQEAVIAVARLRPDMFSTTIKIAFDADTRSYKLADNYEYPLEVLGIISEDGCVRSLRSSTEADKIDDGACWRLCDNNTSDVDPTHFVWSYENPRCIYIDGSAKDTDKLLVTSFTLDGCHVDGNATNLKAPYSYFPEIIDYALSRLYAREDTSAGDSSFYLNRFNQMINDRMGIDRNRNPLAAAQMKAKQR